MLADPVEQRTKHGLGRAEPVDRLLQVAHRFGKLGEVWPRGGTSARTRLGYLYHLFEFQ